MADKGSVAPKERVNIVFKPGTGDTNEEVELPLKLMMIGDYTGKKDDTPLEDRKTVSVDKSNFNDVLGSQNVNLSVKVPNKLSGDDSSELSVSVSMKSLSDFEPESIVKQVPELNKLLELRHALTALKGPLGNVPAFRRKLEEMILDENLRDQLLAEVTKDLEQK